MRYRSKSTLFLIEQLIVIAVFAICAAACISILAHSYFLARDSRDVSNALLVGETVAESFKAVSGDFQLAAELSGGSVGDVDGSQSIVVFYDDSWQVSNESAAEYVLRLTQDDGAARSSRLLAGELTVSRISGDELVAFPVALRR